jgi:hypothetical protein
LTRKPQAVSNQLQRLSDLGILAHRRDGKSIFYRGGPLLKRYVSWSRSCCHHPLMAYASERVGAWADCEAFREVLARVGWSCLPTLTRELPESNEGQTAPPDAEAALRELAVFRRSRPAEFLHIVEPLERIFRASVETGNPVEWC